MPLSLHEFAGFERIYWESTAEKRTVANAVASHEVETTFATFILSGILERFPRLRIISAELNCGWLAYFLHRMDRAFDSRGVQLQGSPFPTKLTMRPSEYFRRQLYATFIDDPYGLDYRHEIGVDNLLWASIFAHRATFGHNSSDILSRGCVV